MQNELQPDPMIGALTEAYLAKQRRPDHFGTWFLVVAGGIVFLLLRIGMLQSPPDTHFTVEPGERTVYFVTRHRAFIPWTGRTTYERTEFKYLPEYGFAEWSIQRQGKWVPIRFQDESWGDDASASDAQRF